METNDFETFALPEGWMDAPTENIMLAFCKTYRYLSSHQTIVCSLSGGADSDVMLDLVHQIDRTGKVQYVFFDTGLEMQATKDHIQYLEDKYDISIDVVKPCIPIPLACKSYGQPFFTKKISENIERLQRHGFKWEDEPLDVLLKRYPKCRASLRWWCNDFGDNSRFNISCQPYLKEFMHKHPPQFKISPKCCDCAKKKPAIQYSKSKNADLTLVGIRKAEGGVRSTAYKSCFSESIKYGDRHFPLFWFSNDDKREYDSFYHITHSAAYSVYGCKRTGCAACPFGSRFEQELLMLKNYEPKLYLAVINIFGDSIKYTRAYRTYKFKHDLDKECAKQLFLDDV